MKASTLGIALHVFALLCLGGRSTQVHAEPIEEPAVEARPSSNAEPASIKKLQNKLVLGSSGNTELRFHLATWLRWNSVIESGTTESTFSIPLARPVVEASFFEEKVKVFAQEELAGARTRLLDAFVDIRLHDSTSLRVGQFRTPYSRAFPTPIIKLQLPDRGPVVNAFHLGRETGAMLHGRGKQGALEFYLGVFGGGTNDDTRPLATAPWPIVRVAYNLGAGVPYDQSVAAGGRAKSGIALGASGAYRRQDVETATDMYATKVGWHASGDVSAASGGLSATAEFFYRNEKVAGGVWQRGLGGYAQGGYFVIPQHLELAARGGWRQQKVDEGEVEERIYEVAVNGYPSIEGHPQGHHLKAMARYRLTQSEGAGMIGGRQTSHLVTILGQLWF